MNILMNVVGFGAGIVTLATAALTGYGTLNASPAANFDQSMGQVVNQADRMGTSLSDAGTYVEEEITEVDVKYITDIVPLIDQWKPRYSSAIAAYNRFAASIESATDLADAYFDAQSELTERYNSPARREQARAQDQAEFERFVEWRYSADQKLQLATAIMRRMEDMDIDLEKSRLSSELSSEFSQFSSIPDEILQLSSELAGFQIASRNVREAIDAEFLAQ